MAKTSAVGIDVSQATLAAKLRRPDGTEEFKEFLNTPPGHKRLITWAGLKAQSVRAVVESTGTYSYDLAVALHQAPGFEVMVLASKRARHFARSLGRRDKDDAIDADVLLRFALLMPFEAWTPPPVPLQQLRSITRQIRALQKLMVAQGNQRHAASRTVSASKTVLKSASRVLTVLEREIQELFSAAKRLVEADPELQRDFRLLQTIKGVGARSALLLLGEIGMLPPGLSAREWVSHAGLCPRRFDSGSSVRKPGQIGKAGNMYLRAALFMPALAACRFDSGARAFAERLRASGKKRIQTVVAIMRKLLHAAHAVLATKQPYDSARLFPA